MEKFKTPLELIKFILEECSDMSYGFGNDPKWTPPYFYLSIDKNFNLERFVWCCHLVKQQFDFNIDALVLRETVELPNNLLEQTELKAIRSYNTHLYYLPKLPETLKFLDVSHNELIELPELPSGLEELYCQENNIEKLPKLPNSLKKLRMDHSIYLSFKREIQDERHKGKGRKVKNHRR